MHHASLTRTRVQFDYMMHRLLTGHMLQAMVSPISAPQRNKRDDEFVILVRVSREQNVKTFRFR